MSKKKLKKTRANKYAQDVHHLLWQRRHWKSGWSKMLREHQYMKALIPRNTLHKQIHEFIGDIPVPEGKYCKLAYLEIESRLEEGTIQFDDFLEKRLDLLIELWKDSCPQTVRALSMQRNIISHFYNGRR